VVRFEPGRTVLRRFWRGGRIGFLNVARVVGDDERGLRLWIPSGASYWRIIAPDGRTHHDGPIDALGEHAALTELTWTGSSVLVWMAPARAYSVWWFFDPKTGDFAGWYGNLEDPYARWDDGAAAGVDTADHALDLLIAPDGSWRFKDLEEFTARIGHPLYWTTAEAAEIRAEGERLGALASARAFPFDGTWSDFRPDPTWPTPQRPPGWDRPRADGVRFGGSRTDLAQWSTGIRRASGAL
jgi:hypothetical protein